MNERQQADLELKEARNQAEFWRDIACGAFSKHAKLPWELREVISTLQEKIDLLYED